VVTHPGGVGYREVYPSMAHGETMRYNPTPSAGSHRLAAVADPFRLQALAAGWHHGICLPAPDTPAAAAPVVPLAERLAALRAAVMGAPVWTPPPRPSRPVRAAAEPVDASTTAAEPA
jgi:hypothetical protein